MPNKWWPWRSSDWSVALADDRSRSSRSANSALLGEAGVSCSKGNLEGEDLERDAL